MDKTKDLLLDHTKAEIEEIKQAQRELDEQYVKNHEDLTRQLEGTKTLNVKRLAEASTYFRPRKETSSVLAAVIELGRISVYYTSTATE